MTKEERIATIERHVRELSEIYDAVQIMGTWLSEEGYTKSHKRGSGNLYARLGMASEFIQEQIDEDAANVIAQKLNPPDDDWKGADAGS